MAGYKCKKCNTKNPVLKEWIELGISRVVTCSTCGHKMNLNLEPRPSQNNPGTQVTEKAQGFNHFVENGSGTNVVGINKKSQRNYKLKILKNRTAANNLAIKTTKDMYSIFLGRNPETASASFNKEIDVSWILDDEYLSRAHCVIKVQKNNNKIQFILEDLNSTNGTIVNNNKLEKGDQVFLHIDDEVEVGDTMFTLIQE